MIVGIFSSSRDQPYEIIVCHLMTVLSSLQWEITYGGGNKGLMGIVYKCAIEQLVPIQGHNMERWHSYQPNEIVYTSFMDRQNGLVYSSDVYLVLPGGIGTLFELLQVLTLNDVEKVNKKVILYNIDGMYDPFLEMMFNLIEKGMVDKDRLCLYIVTGQDEIKDLLYKMEMKQDFSIYAF